MSKGPMYCRTCEKNQIKTEIYFDNFHKAPSGKSIPLERFGGQPHQCPYSEYALKQNGLSSAKQPSSNVPSIESERMRQEYKITPPTLPSVTLTDEHHRAVLLAKIDNLNVGIAKVMSMLQQVTQLVEVLVKKEDNFVPANQVPTQEEKETFTQDAYDDHIREMVDKGKKAEDEEELDLT